MGSRYRVQFQTIVSPYRSPDIQLRRAIGTDENRTSSRKQLSFVYRAFDGSNCNIEGHPCAVEVLVDGNEEKIYQRSDERILGDGDFVERVLSSAEEAMEKRDALRAPGVDLGFIASRVLDVLGLKMEEVWERKQSVGGL